jgi:RimJ/RimL family protein N-acetyltransferase
MHLQEATEADIPFIVEVEHAPEFREYVVRWTNTEHTAAMRDSDTRYFLAMNDGNEPVGYVILRGLQSEDRNFELKRVVVRAPGRGYGRQVLRLLLEKVFRDFGARRLWLDVFETNLRAQHLYRNLGFQQDGIFREVVYRDGQYHSLVLMSLLDREYDEKL